MPDTPVERQGPPAYDPNQEARISRLEGDVQDVKTTLAQLVPTLARIDSMLTATLPHLATKAELAELRNHVNASVNDTRRHVDATGHDLGSRIDAGLADMRKYVDAGLNETRRHTDDSLNALRAHLDSRSTEFKSDTAAILATLAHMATKAELAEKPGKAYLWGVVASLVAAYAAGLAALAVLH